MPATRAAGRRRGFSRLLYWSLASRGCRRRCPASCPRRGGWVGKDIGEQGRIRSVTAILDTPSSALPRPVRGYAQRVGAGLAARRRCAGGLEEGSCLFTAALIGDSGSDLPRRIHDFQDGVEIGRRDAQPDLLSRGEARSTAVRPSARSVAYIITVFAEHASQTRACRQRRGASRHGRRGGIL